MIRISSWQDRRSVNHEINAAMRHIKWLRHMHDYTDDDGRRGRNMPP